MVQKVGEACCAATERAPLPVQASLDEEAAGATRMSALAMQQQAAAADGDTRGSSGAGAGVVATPGLQNRIGEYNCFLNVIIQCLWQCGAFRTRLLQLSPQQVQVRVLPSSRLALPQPLAPRSRTTMVRKCTGPQTHRTPSLHLFTDAPPVSLPL